MMDEKKITERQNENKSLSVEELAAVAAHLYQNEKVINQPQQNVNQQALSAWQTAAWLGQLRGGC